MEQLSAHLGNAKFVCILIAAPNDKKNIRPLLTVAWLKTSERKTPFVTPLLLPRASPRVFPGRLQGRRQRQPAPAAGRTGTALAVTAQPPGRAGGRGGGRVRQDQAGGRGVHGRKAAMAGFWERELFPPSRAAGAGAERCGERCGRAGTSGSGDAGPGQSPPSASPGALASKMSR